MKKLGKDYWGRETYQDKGRILKDVEGTLHTVTSQGEPLVPVRKKLTFSKKKKWVATDGWRGYEEPVYAIAGVNDTGMWSDSPSPSNKTNAELHKFRATLNKLGIPTRKVTGQTSNVFAGNQFLIAPKELYPTAKQKVKELLKNKNYDWVWEV